jgi:hypothetical protein
MHSSSSAGAVIASCIACRSGLAGPSVCTAGAPTVCHGRRGAVVPRRFGLRSKVQGPHDPRSHVVPRALRCSFSAPACEGSPRVLTLLAARSSSWFAWRSGAAQAKLGRATSKVGAAVQCPFIAGIWLVGRGNPKQGRVSASAVLYPARPNISIEGTSNSQLRCLSAAPHVKR